MLQALETDVEALKYRVRILQVLLDRPTPAKVLTFASSDLQDATRLSAFLAEGLEQMRGMWTAGFPAERCRFGLILSTATFVPMRQYSNLVLERRPQMLQNGIMGSIDGVDILLERRVPNGQMKLVMFVDGIGLAWFEVQVTGGLMP